MFLELANQAPTLIPLSPPIKYHRRLGLCRRQEQAMLFFCTCKKLRIIQFYFTSGVTTIQATEAQVPRSELRHMGLVTYMCAATMFTPQPAKKARQQVQTSIITHCLETPLQSWVWSHYGRGHLSQMKILVTPLFTITYINPT